MWLFDFLRRAGSRSSDPLVLRPKCRAAAVHRTASVRGTDVAHSFAGASA